MLSSPKSTRIYRPLLSFVIKSSVWSSKRGKIRTKSFLMAFEKVWNIPLMEWMMSVFANTLSSDNILSTMLPIHLYMFYLMNEMSVEWMTGSKMIFFYGGAISGERVIWVFALEFLSILKIGKQCGIIKAAKTLENISRFTLFRFLWQTKPKRDLVAFWHRREKRVK